MSADRKSRVCEVCGTDTRNDAGRCTNGRCGACHRAHCTAGGVTSPGHGRGTVATPFDGAAPPRFEWPKNADGSRKVFGDLTREQRRAAVQAVIPQLEKEITAVLARVAAQDAIDKASKTEGGQ